jgi:regulator of sigma E protease
VTLAWFALLVGVLVTVHELGHYVAARLFGVRVVKAAVGFGRAIFSHTHKGTEYAVNVIPLGGYVRLYGEEADSPIAAEDRERAFGLRPAWQRLAIVLAGPAFNVAFAALVFTQLALNEAGAATATIGAVFAGTPADDAGLRAGDRVVSVDDQAIATWDELNARVLSAPGHELRITIERSAAPGEPVHTLTKVVTPRVHMRTDPFGTRQEVGLIGVAPYFQLPQVGVVDTESAAYKAGLRTFDVVTAIHGRPVATASDLDPLVHPRGSGMIVVTYLRPIDAALGFTSLARLEPRSAQVVPQNISPPGKPTHYDAGIRPASTFVNRVEPESPAASLGLARGDEVLTLDGQPALAWELIDQQLDEHPLDEHTVTWRGPDESEHHGRFTLQRRSTLDEYQAESTFYVFGAEGARAIAPIPALPADRNIIVAGGRGIARALSATSTLARVLVLTLVRRLPATSIGGPLLVYQVAGVAAQHGLDHFLAVAALISLNLGLLNLLPVPLLDGGQASLIIIEGVRRRPVSPRARERATLIGLALLAALMLLALRNDVVRHLSAMWR